MEEGPIDVNRLWKDSFLSDPWAALLGEQQGDERGLDGPQQSPQQQEHCDSDAHEEHDTHKDEGDAAPQDAGDGEAPSAQLRPRMVLPPPQHS
eukprot:m51a1_g5631 hypothetical protein (93) ;mRNA; f:807134-807412